MTQSSSVPTARDPDLINAEIALQRAARRVRERARRTGSALAYADGDKVRVEVPRDEPDDVSTRDCRKG